MTENTVDRNGISGVHMNLDGGQYDLPTDSLKVLLDCEVESRSASFGDRQDITGINSQGESVQITFGRIPTEGSLCCLMLVIGERFRFDSAG